MRRAPLPTLLALSLGLGAPGCRQPPPRPLAATPALASVPGNGRTEGEIASLQAQLRKRADAETWVKLARAFVRKARESSDPGFYVQADDAAGRALALDGDHAGALQVRQLVLLSAHRFVEARRLAEQQIKLRPRDVVAWGTLGDAALELGDYETAHSAHQIMIDLKPDLRSYSRGAWLRWLSGDSEGALELMQMAVDAGGPRDPEARAYCRVQFGDMLVALGRYDEARTHYDLALRELPGYGPAYLGRGRLSLVLGRTGEALSDLGAALRVQPTTAVRAAYIDALWAAGREAEAEAEIATLEREGRREDPRTLSLFLSTQGRKPELALELAQVEARRRPDIWSLDALAWALYRNGRYDEAWTAAQAATRLGTPDPRLLYHRGQIAAALERRDEARARLQAALAQSPRWDLREPQEARATLASLDAPRGGRP